MTNRSTLLALAIALLPATAAHAQEGVRTIPLPADLRYPEGVGLDPAGHIFTASATDGTVVRTSLKDGRSTTLSGRGILFEADGTVFPHALGIKRDGAGRVWIAGGLSGRIFVLDGSSGKLIRELRVPGTGSALNDMVIADDAVYVTDTLRPVMWRIPIESGTIGEPQAWIDFNGTPLVHTEGRNLNGIVRSTDGKSLIAVQMDKGRLFRIDLATRTVAPIDVGGEAISGGDGLVLDGSTLYLVRQPENEVVTLRLDPALTSARVVTRFRHPALRWPATAVKVGNELLVVNSQFDKRATNDPALPFSVVAIPLSALAPRP